MLAASARKLAPNLAPQRAKLGAHLRQVVRPDLNVRGIFKGFWTSPGRNEHLEFDLRTLTLVRKVAQVAALGGSSDRNKSISDLFLDAHSGSGRSKST